MKVGTVVKAWCNSCVGSKWHAVLHEALQSYPRESEEDADEYYYYSMLQCRGCDSVVLAEEGYINGQDMYHGHPNYYPPPSLRRRPEWLWKWWAMSGLGGKPVFTICQEVYKALQNSQLHLAAMGVRAVLELAVIDKIGGDRRSFAENLNALYDQGHVSLLMKDRLATVLDVGSATIHRGHSPTREDLNVLVDIMEHIIESLYIHEEDVKRLAQRTPPRPPRIPTQALQRPQMNEESAVKRAVLNSDLDSEQKAP
ncbi:DUF4145 domain-containing protein [Burkholderia gladioli]|uniref:DUF4145 domain-containing protein n=1 Tax=Burkholderia gladioli TaxID=28095 RepID=UPI001C26325A|nr:DUF4145 domain-containing protein [Burkholderia gladioli]MBU9382119.1 DUF4145 domain-containing protein [Burkholderia gladioli]